VSRFDLKKFFACLIERSFANANQCLASHGG